MSKKILIRIDTPALGDTLCGTPTVRKAYQSYGHKLYIQSGRPDVFERSPYVEKVYHLNDKLNLSNLQKLKIINSKYKSIKLLGLGEIKEKIHVEVNFISKSAKEKIEKSGGKVTLIK